MTYDPAQHHRRSIRLPAYDYAQAGAYFVTIVTNVRACLFGEILDGEMRLSKAGEIVAQEWQRSAEIREEIKLDEWVVMPNHIHGIIFIKESMGGQPVGAHSGAPLRGRAPRSLGVDHRWI